MFRRGRALRSGRSRYSAEGDPGASGHPSSPEPAPDLGLEHRGEGWLRFARQGPFGPRVLDGLGQAAADAGPLPEKTRHLVQLAAAAAIRSEGAVHSHARRALAAGATAEEIQHAVIALTSTIGFPNVMAALSWINDVKRGTRW
jgi:4-carboxymuconolactone decarboxylase